MRLQLQTKNTKSGANLVYAFESGFAVERGRKACKTRAGVMIHRHYTAQLSILFDYGFWGVECSPMAAMAGAAFQDAHDRQPPPSNDEDGALAGAGISSLVAAAAAAGSRVRVDDASSAVIGEIGCWEARTAEVEDEAARAGAIGAVVEVERLALGLSAEKFGSPRLSETRLLAPSSDERPLRLAILAADLSLSFCSARSAPPPPPPDSEVKLPAASLSPLPMALGFHVTRSARSSASCKDSCAARSRSESDRDALGLTALEYTEARLADLCCCEVTSLLSRSLSGDAGFHGVASTLLMACMLLGVGGDAEERESSMALSK